MKEMPPWVVGVAIIGVIMIVSLLFFSSRPFECTRNGGGFSCGFVHDPSSTEEKKYYGYFYDWDENKNSYCSSETVYLKFYDDEISIKARSVGIMKDRDGNSAEGSWLLQGYKHGNNLAMAYVSDYKPRSGNGVYYLVPNQGEYAGFWIGIDSPSGKVIRCPYVLTTKEKGRNESCEDRWRRVFSPANACKEVIFSADG